MQRWVPVRSWEGEDAYVVGGGPSLRGFDWDLIRGRCAVGCNGAFSLGAHVVPYLVFGDGMWWTNIGRSQLPQYGGVVVACAPELKNDRTEWALWADRAERPGLGLDKLGWNGHTGSLAINLALCMGARRVFLLGFDMHLGEDGEPNWHRLRYEKGHAHVYERYLGTTGHILRDVAEKFPGSELWNVTDGSSSLNPTVQRVHPAELFGVAWGKKGRVAP